MRFEIKLSYIPTAESRAAGEADPQTVFEMDGDLDAVKTYLKLSVGDNFNWGAIKRVDELTPGDVEQWMVQKNRTTGELSLKVFSFYEVDPEINLNAMMAAFDERTGTEDISKLLGGGKF